MTQARIKGAKEMLAFLDAFPKRLRNNAVRAALTAAAEPILQQARANVPGETGKLAKAIKKGRPKVNQDGTVSIRIRVDKDSDHGFLAHMIEWGTSPHLIARTAKGQGRVAVRKAHDGRGNIDHMVMKIGGNFVSGIINRGKAAEILGFLAERLIRQVVVEGNKQRTRAPPIVATVLEHSSCTLQAAVAGSGS